ncbi:hypothetical protein [Arthrobacter sp. zg-Y1110]|uniref:hypothetical protein n=1 Tax=Arthrobacter sp. zg-Y1110 TaxID=2886932 RepID=UPI001D156C10|nr:hypothetical protein [Arthrobacter sp. zg-Y1110]MCC3292946.1 hypothetical protein [Arthrobacter sp. zg-Y1110]UWX86885.1 hypothetical protein N2K99_18755 [Arthrobacter sp. zg-Y1110]
MNERPQSASAAAEPLLLAAPESVVLEMNKPARPVFAVQRPLSLTRSIEIADALTSLHGTGITVEEMGNRFVFFTPGRRCSCLHCCRYLAFFADRSPEHVMAMPCTECGNDRCPRAIRHTQNCTGGAKAL